MFDIVVYCHATKDGRRSAGVSVNGRDDFEWDAGGAAADEADRDPTLNWYVEMRVPWDQPVPTREDARAWFRGHRGALAVAALGAADQVPLGLSTEVVRWGKDFDWPAGPGRLTVAARNSYHARRLGDYLREFAAGPLGGPARPAEALAVQAAG